MSRSISPLNFLRIRRQVINLAVLFLAGLILMLQLCSIASAQGTLSKIGASVRSAKSTPRASGETATPKPDNRPAPKSSHGDQHHDHEAPNPRLGGKLAAVEKAVRHASIEPDAGKHRRGVNSHQAPSRRHGRSRNRRRLGHQSSFRPPTWIVADPNLPLSPGFVLPPVTVVEPLFVRQPVVVQEPIFIQESVLVHEPIFADESIAMGGQDYVSPVGARWFQDTNSKLWATFGTDFDDITSGNLGVLFQAKRSIGLQVSLGTLRESGADFRDHLWLGDANLVYQFINRPNFKASVGGGLNWLATNSGNNNWNADAGLNLKFTADLKLTKRLTVSADSNWGTLGQADYTRTRVSLNRRFESVDVLIGAEHLAIGGTEINSMFTGVQLRF